MKTGLLKALFLTLTLGFSSLSFAEVKVVKASQLPAGCHNLGNFEADAGYGKQLDGQRIALYRAKKKAEAAGANYAVILELNRGPSDLNGYCLLTAYHCGEHQ